MNKLINLINYFLVKIILFIQFIKYRILKKDFSKDRIELFKHKLNFYLHKIKKRKHIKVNFEYKFGSDIKEKMFKVDINKFTGFDGYYTFNGEGPLFKGAKEIYLKPNIKIEDSYLYYFYNTFQPKNYGELYKLNLNNSLYKIPSFLQFKPWINSFADPKNIRKGLFGPCEFKDVEHRLIRIKNLFKNIRELGYIPSEKDIIKGYILHSKDDFRFLVTSGHHRVAVLKVLNYLFPNQFNLVTVAFEENRCNLRFIDEKNIDRWPAVVNNFCSKKDALEIFNKFFYT